MKQKNLAMLGVAVGCGLVAAVAVAKLSAGGSKQQDTIKVLVAKRDLPVQTKLEEKELDNLIQWADMPKGLAPGDAVTDLEQAKGKSLNRTLKQGNPLSITDLGDVKKLILPDGYKAMAVRATQVDAVAGFVKPGDKVDVLFVERMQGTGKIRSAILLRQMLVLAVNMHNTVDEKTGAAIPQVESVSLAVNDKQATLLTLADERGHLKLMLTSGNPNDVVTQKNGGEIEWLDDPFLQKEPGFAPAGPPPVKMDTAVVARKSVPLNTLINSDNVNEFFTTVELKTAPEGVVTSADDLKGRYIVRNLEAGQYMYKSLTGVEQVQIEKPAAPGPVAPPPEVRPTERPVPVKTKFPRFEQIIQEGGYSKRIIWLEVTPNKWKRFDSERDAEAYQPEAPKAEDKDSPKTDQ
jgi:pilus assembly protein CpaB